MIITRQFPIARKLDVSQINRFFDDNSIDRTQVLLATTVQISHGNPVFLLVYEDVSPPYVTGHSPADGAQGTPTGVDIVINFSEPIADPSGEVSITRNGSALSEGTDFALEPTSWPADGSSVLTIKNAVDSTYNAAYVVTLSSDVADVNGNTMENAYTFSFTSSTQEAGIVFKAGSVTPSAGDITNGYSTIVFASAMPDTNYYAVAAPEGTGAMPGVGLRISNKGTGSFRINFDGEDFSGVESEIDSVVQEAMDNIDAAHKDSINTDHAKTSHADPDNPISTMTSTGASPSAVTDRDFIATNLINWIALHGAGT